MVFDTQTFLASALSYWLLRKTYQINSEMTPNYPIFVILTLPSEFSNRSTYMFRSFIKINWCMMKALKKQGNENLPAMAGDWSELPNFKWVLDRIENGISTKVVSTCNNLGVQQTSRAVWQHMLFTKTKQ